MGTIEPLHKRINGYILYESGVPIVLLYSAPKTWYSTAMVVSKTYSSSTLSNVIIRIEYEGELLISATALKLGISECRAEQG